MISLLPGLLITASLLAMWVGIRRAARIRRAVSLRWPEHVTVEAAIQNARIYLRGAGWIRLGEWPWLNIRVRATKNNQVLNLFVPDPVLGSPERAIKDADELANKLNAIIVVLMCNPRRQVFTHIPCPPRVIIIEPLGLAGLDENIRLKLLDYEAAGRARETRRAAWAAKEAADRDECPTVEAVGSFIGRIQQAVTLRAFEDAEAIAREALSVHPYSREIRMQAGLVWFQQRHFDDAAEQFEQLRADFPGCADAWRYTAMSYRSLKQFDKAEQVVEEATRRFPENPAIRLEAAWNAMQTDHLEEASTRWAHLRLNFPGFHEPFWAASSLALRLGDTHRAEKICQEGYALFPKNGHMLWQWALSATRRKDWQEAERRWGEAVALYPDIPEIRNAYGQFVKERASHGEQSEL